MTRSRNEKTSPRVSRIAAKVLNVGTKKGFLEVTFDDKGYGPCRVYPTVKWQDIRALAASCLTQTASRKERWEIDPHDLKRETGRRISALIKQMHDGMLSLNDVREKLGLDRIPTDAAWRGMSARRRPPTRC